MTQLPPVGPYMPLPIPAGCGKEAWRLGRLVHEHSQQPGAHRTPAAELGNDVLSHAKGKYGELAFQLWLAQQEFTTTHTPFRDDYTRKVPDDDFIVNGIRFEIKTKMRNPRSPFPPPSHYNVNLGKKEIEEAIHVFIEVSSRATMAPLRSRDMTGTLQFETCALQLLSCEPSAIKNSSERRWRHFLPNFRRTKASR
jgi:hypothetical protein